MKRGLRAFRATGWLLLPFFLGQTAFAQISGGILKIYMPDSPASMSIHEEATVVAQRPMMGVFNNLVMFDQQVQQNSLGSIIPDLAIGWSWNEDGTELTFPLHEGARWHDRKPLTATDLQCPRALRDGKSNEQLRINPRTARYTNLPEGTTRG